MKADSLPEEPNNLNSQASEETNALDASQPAEIPLTSETSASEESNPSTSAEVSLTEPIASQESEVPEVAHPSEPLASEEVQIQDAPNPGEISLPETVANEVSNLPEAPHPSETSLTEPVASEEVQIQDVLNLIEISLSETVASEVSEAPDVPHSPETLLPETVASDDIDAPDAPHSPETPLTETVASEGAEAPEALRLAEPSPPETFSYPLPPSDIPKEVSLPAAPRTEITPEEAGVDSISELPHEPSSRSTPELTPIETLATPAIESESEAYPLDTEKKNKRIFITGASGCIGHYITETLIRETEHELYLLVRNPDKLQFDCNTRPGIHVLQGDMREIGRFSKLLKTIDCAVLVAAAWGGQSDTLDINVLKPIQLLELLDPKVCQQVIYFSTASVLDKNNEVLKEAVQLGTDYIRTKADFLRRISRLPIAKRMTILFPTLVLGGDDYHPYSHLSGGLPGLTKWIDLIRWFKADASFHFIHGKDIAEVVAYLIAHPLNSQDSRWLVLGNPPVTVNQAVEEACAYLNRRIFFRLPLSLWLANLFIALFNIQMSAWDRFCLEHQNFTYQNPVNPATFGLPVYCSTFTEVLKISGVSDSRQ